MWWQLFLVIFIIFVIFFHWKRRKYAKLHAEFKTSFRELPFIGHAYRLAGNDEDIMNEFKSMGMEAIDKGGVTSYWMLQDIYLNVSDPVIAEFVLKTCLKKGTVTRFFRHVLGNGSVMAPMPVWRRRRRMLVPTFNTGNLRQFMKIFSKQSGVMAEQLRPMVEKGPFSLWRYFATYSMDTISESTLGVKLHAQKNPNQPFLEAFDTIARLMAARACQAWLHIEPLYRMLPQFKELSKSSDIVHEYIDQVIQSKRKAAIDEPYKQLDPQGHLNLRPKSLRSFVELLMNSSEDNKACSELELQEETLVLMIAGTDTSAAATSFTALMLSRYPDVQEKVYEELKEVFGESLRPVENNDLPELQYLEAVINETLRLYPPVPIIIRTVKDDTNLPSGATLVAGTNILINIWAIHRNPSYWGPNAEEFRPDRFINPEFKHPAQFMAFSNGPRDCIGYRYAMMSMKTALATILRQYRLKPATMSMSNSACNGETHPATANPRPPIRLRWDLMMKDVDNFVIELESRA